MVHLRSVNYTKLCVDTINCENSHAYTRNTTNTHALVVTALRRANFFRISAHCLSRVTHFYGIVIKFNFNICIYILSVNRNAFDVNAVHDGEDKVERVCVCVWVYVCRDSSEKIVEQQLFYKLRDFDISFSGPFMHTQEIICI